MPETFEIRARFIVKLLDVIVVAPPVIISCLADIKVLPVANVIGARAPEQVAPLLNTIGELNVVPLSLNEHALPDISDFLTSIKEDTGICKYTSGSVADKATV